MKILMVYDDTQKKADVIRDVIGDKGFADVVVKKKRLGAYYEEALREVFPQGEMIVLSSAFAWKDLLESLERRLGSDTRVVHCFSHYIFSDRKKALLTFAKLPYIDGVYRVDQGSGTVAIMFPGLASYIRFLQRMAQGQTPAQLIRQIPDRIPIQGMTDISQIHHFIQCIAGNFDARYFNSLTGDEYIIVKSSSNKEKIRAEYTFYHLLPEDMRFWFVEPFRYQDQGETASYSMERLHMTDLAVKWVHGSVDLEEFDAILDKYFYFFQSRHQKPVSREEYRRNADALYRDKVERRVAQLKAHPAYPRIRALLAQGEGQSLDEMVEEYFRLKKEVEARVEFPAVSVIGHGDPCFSNAMYNKSTRTLKFIDPKGALEEKDLWTDPYYDIAKLSHSVCGQYDFFNNALFEIRIGEDLSPVLEIDFDNRAYIQAFRKKLEEKGYSYLAVRLYEASLFLSMLPLHIDNPRKVLGFLLNARNILKEVQEECTKDTP